MDELELLRSVREERSPSHATRERHRAALQVSIEHAIANPKPPVARRGRSRGWLLVAAAVAVVVFAVAASVALTSGNDEPSRISTPVQQPTVTSTPQVTPSAAADVPTFSAAEVEAMLTPASNGDFASSRRMLYFTSLVNNAATNECLTAAGYSASPRPDFDPTLGFRYFEDPTVIEANGFFTTVDAPASPSEGSSVPADVASKCGADTEAATRALDEATSPFYTWMGDQSQIEASAAVQSSYAGWATCMAGHGIESTSEGQFLFDLQKAYDAAAPEAKRGLDLQMSAAYADCIQRGPMQARTDARLAYRSAFTQQRGIDWVQTADHLNAAIGELSSRYGINFPQ